MKSILYPEGLAYKQIQQEVEDILTFMGGSIIKREGHALTARIPITLRFWEGEAVVNVTILPHREVRLETEEETFRLNPKGKLFAWSGVLATVPWILWPFFPALLPIAGFCGLLLFMVWLGVGRRPEEKVALQVAQILRKRWKT